MAKFKAAIDQCRGGNLSAMFDLEISLTELITINALAKATGDTFEPDAAVVGLNEDQPKPIGPIRVSLRNA
jgi:hypothetical protein